MDISDPVFLICCQLSYKLLFLLCPWISVFLMLEDFSLCVYWPDGLSIQRTEGLFFSSNGIILILFPPRGDYITHWFALLKLKGQCVNFSITIIMCLAMWWRYLRLSTHWKSPEFLISSTDDIPPCHQLRPSSIISLCLSLQTLIFLVVTMLTNACLKIIYPKKVVSYL